MGYVDILIANLATAARIPGLQAVFDTLNPLAARTFLGRSDLQKLLTQLQAERLLGIGESGPLKWRVTLTLEGWARADEFHRQRGRLTQAFVAMWFDEATQPVYADGIRPALVACGYKPPFRVDDAEYQDKWKQSSDEARKDQKIDDRILGAIRRSRFLVVDMTGQRQSVYFEAGFAEGLGIPIIWTCREEEQKRGLAFDTRQTEHLLWNSPDQLRSDLIARIDRRGWRLD